MSCRRYNAEFVTVGLAYLYVVTIPSNLFAFRLHMKRCITHLQQMAVGLAQMPNTAMSTLPIRWDGSILQMRLAI